MADPVLPVPDDSSRSARKSVPVTLWLPREIVARISEDARVSGLSRNAYLSRVIGGTPTPPLAVSTALGTSTEQLAVLSTDLRELLRTLALGACVSGAPLEDRVQALVHDVRRHLAIASRLVSELRPARRITNSQASEPVARPALHS